MTADDPLAGADVGETITVERETTHYHLTPEAVRGEDRFADVDIEAVHYDPEYDRLHIEWDAEVTKALPPRWDECREPLTDAVRTRQRRKRWAKKLLKPVLFGATTLLVVYVTHAIMNTLAGELVINGEVMHAPSDSAFLGMAVLIVAMATAMQIVTGDGQGRAMGGRR